MFKDAFWKCFQWIFEQASTDAKQCQDVNFWAGQYRCTNVKM